MIAFSVVLFVGKQAKGDDFLPSIEVPLMGGITTWTNQPTSTAELTGSRHKFDFTDYQQARISLQIVATGTGSIGIQFAGATTSAILGSLVSETSTGIQTTPWFNMPWQMRTDVVMRVVGVGGNGTADPQIANIGLQIR